MYFISQLVVYSLDRQWAVRCMFCCSQTLDHVFLLTCFSPGECCSISLKWNLKQVRASNNVIVYDEAQVPINRHFFPPWIDRIAKWESQFPWFHPDSMLAPCSFIPPSLAPHPLFLHSSTLIHSPLPPRIPPSLHPTFPSSLDPHPNILFFSSMPSSSSCIKPL